jgi:hypothetical protein
MRSPLGRFKTSYRNQTRWDSNIYVQILGDKIVSHHSTLGLFKTSLKLYKFAFWRASFKLVRQCLILNLTLFLGAVYPNTSQSIKTDIQHSSTKKYSIEPIPHPPPIQLCGKHPNPLRCSTQQPPIQMLNSTSRVIPFPSPDLQPQLLVCNPSIQ